jgi:SAM-dependent methyltransferase
MEEQLEIIRKAYDLTVEMYNKGINPMDNIPEEIKNSNGYESLIAARYLLNSGAADIKKYLNPGHGMCFLDAGCSANIANYRLDRWSSTYYGIDISPGLIQAMQNYVNRNKLNIGGLYVADVSKMPFENGFFDIAAMIGVLEYYTFEYLQQALLELNRVLKPASKVVLDIPNQDHPYVGDMVKIEKFLKRPNFIHSRKIFEELLTKLFLIERIDDSQVMIKYFIRAIK